MENKRCQLIFYEYKKDHDKTYIFHVVKNISKRNLLKAIKVRSGFFAWNLFSRVYDCFYSEMIDLFDEYRKYHNREYGTFSDFLQKKYNLPAKVAVVGEKKLLKYKNTALLWRKEHVTGDYNLEMFIMSSDGAQNILSSVLGVSDED